MSLEAEGASGVERAAFVVRGRVQGVGFRWSTVRRARDLDLEGSVWNRPDGGVEVHARGSADALAALASWLGEGPAHAKVDRVETIAPGAPAEGPGFQVRRPEG
jgi:acylphosphatase